jgi:hypothetical protein
MIILNLKHKIAITNYLKLKTKMKNMVLFLIGWLFLLALWFPKPFIKNERKLALINMILSGLAFSIFITELLNQFNK